jgi:hypothetical protein
MKIIKRILAFITIVLLVPLFKARLWIIKKLLQLRAKLQIGSLRDAIGDADKNKETTGRKNMVVFNTTSGKYEPIQKKQLKVIAKVSKNKSNKSMTPGRVKMMKASKPRVIDTNRIKNIEKKSLYVTN